MVLVLAYFAAIKIKVEKKVGFHTRLVINYPDRGDKWFSLKSLKITPTVINYPVLNYPYPTVYEK